LELPASGAAAADVLVAARTTAVRRTSGVLVAADAEWKLLLASRVCLHLLGVRLGLNRS
jgi:hypothetical protein